MRIDRLAIRGYRSLYDVELAPGQFTVITGPNNSGKTNLVEAIEFLAEAHGHGLEVAISRKGGIENIAHRRMRRTRRGIAFEVDAVLSLDELGHYGIVTRRSRRKQPDEVTVRHAFEIKASSQAIEADFTVVHEALQLFARARGPEPFLSLSRTGHQVDINVKPSGSARWSDLTYPLERADFRDDFQRYVRHGVKPTDLLAAEISFNPILRHFAATLARTRLYQLVPLEGREPGVPTPNADLARHGRNLPALVSFLQKQHGSAWREILTSMQRIVPGLRDVKTDFTTDRRLALQFVEEGVRRPWSAEDVSDGTIQSLGLFAALIDPRSPLVLIEEPENSVHPWIIRNFVDTCRSVTGKQVLITTHSPVLLNYLEPNELSIAWKRNGRTHVKPLPQLDPHAETLWKEGKSTVFELLDSGRLEETVPGEED